MATISVYYNKLASRSGNIKWKKQLSKQFYRHKIVFKTTNSVDQMKEELKKDVQNKIDYVFAIGGDGTVNEIIQILAGTRTKLLTIPAGTANDLATQLGIKQNIRLITKVFQQKTASKVDLIDINGRLMATNGGSGIPYSVIKQINRYRKEFIGFKLLMKHFKGHIYETMLLKELLLNTSLKYLKLKFESAQIKGNVKTYETPMFFINNQSHLGGHYNIAPKTCNSDGLFNVTIFTHKSKTDLLKSIFKIRSRKFPYDDPELITFETDHLKITNLNTRLPMNFFGDGEELLSSKVVKIQISPKTLHFCCASADQDLEGVPSLELAPST